MLPLEDWMHLHFPEPPNTDLSGITHPNTTPLPLHSNTFSLLANVRTVQVTLFSWSFINTTCHLSSPVVSESHLFCFLWIEVVRTIHKAGPELKEHQCMGREGSLSSHHLSEHEGTDMNMSETMGKGLYAWETSQLTWMNGREIGDPRGFRKRLST